MTFRIAPGWRFFVYVTCFIFLAVAFWTIYTFFDTSNIWVITNAYILSLSSSLLVFSVYSILRIKNESVTILKDRYEVTYAFRSKSITFEETKGFTVDENYIRLHQMHDKSKPVKISKYLGDQFTFIAHLQKN